MLDAPLVTDMPVRRPTMARIRKLYPLLACPDDCDNRLRDHGLTMASLLSSRRLDSHPSRRRFPRIRLEATIPLVQRNDTSADPVAKPVLSSPVAAVTGALGSAFFGWVLLAGLAVVGWLAAEPGTLLGALGVGTQLWLLSNGAGARLGGTTLNLVPWGATAVLALMLSRFAAFAVRQAPVPGLRALGQVTALVAVTYAGAVACVAFAAGRPAGALRGALVAGIVAAAAAAWGGGRALGYDPTTPWPRWARAVPRAVGAATLVMVVGGAGALATSLVVHLERVEQLTRALDPGVAGGIALLVAQLVFVPNLVVWAASYTLGAGFSVGAGTRVAPAETTLELVPGIPLLGALPQEGGGGFAQLAWLGVGVAAGAVAAWTIMRARPAARFDETSLVGALAGTLAGLLFVGVGWLSGGDLGAVRLASMGPPLLPLAVMATVTMGLSGMTVGLVVGLLRRRRR
jgi:hypothetical protein